jgi:hypothetical protein
MEYRRKNGRFCRSRVECRQGSASDWRKLERINLYAPVLNATVARLILAIATANGAASRRLLHILAWIENNRYPTHRQAHCEKREDYFH